MLYLSLVPAAVLLAAAARAARPHPQPVGWGGFLGWGFAATVIPGGLVLESPVALGLWALLGVALLAWQLTRRRARSFVPHALAALLVAYAVAGLFAWRDYARYVELQHRYPLESAADRVPEPRRDDPSPVPAAGGLGWDEKDLVAIDWRVPQLRRLHGRATEAFVNSPGFGAARMAWSPPSEESLRPRRERPDPPPQPESPGPMWEASGPTGAVSPGHRADLAGMHADGVIDFVNPDGWGYVRSRREVAGFLPHAFSRVPEGREWKVVRVELVGLLRHPEPVVYPSDRLPSMADLREANFPTRPLDGFEAAGVEAVRRGEDGFAGRRGDEVRFVGAVRSAEACVKCHGGGRGDLLGAFTYRLRPAGR